MARAICNSFVVRREAQGAVSCSTLDYLWDKVFNVGVHIIYVSFVDQKI